MSKFRINLLSFNSQGSNSREFYIQLKGNTTFNLLHNTSDLIYLLNLQMTNPSLGLTHQSPKMLISSLRQRYKTEQKDQSFIPFLHERDGLGRLILPKHLLPKNDEGRKIQIDFCETLETQMTPPNPLLPQTLEKVQRIDKIIDRSFVFHNERAEKYQSNSPTRQRKKSVLIERRLTEDRALPLTVCFQENLKMKQKSIASTDRQEGVIELDSPLRKKTSQFTLLTPLQIEKNRKMSYEGLALDSPLLEKTPRIKLKTSLSTKARFSTQNQSPVKTQQRIMFADLMKPISVQTFGELSKYNTLKTLEVKLNLNLEEGHNKFIIKMRQSKKLAYKIGLELENL